MTGILSRHLFQSDSEYDWHMQPCERVALLYLLNLLQPSLSIEIGTFKAGSLRPISRYSQRVITFDIDPNQHRLAPLFPNTEFITGDTAITLPDIIRRINADPDAELSFVLVDGSHETLGVKSDIENCLQYVPKSKPCFILMHDSSNPAVRAGIQSSDWAASPYLHAINVDYVPGQLYSRPDIKNQIWGGLGLALMLPERRTGEVEVEAHYNYSIEAFERFVSLKNWEEGILD
ncbi:MAG: class I SAM-dependent methyltransferase [Cyanobacteriota bacterium]|nr:class I SAM-dependent methyltransferase [Cyanobacteriota bacterium]